MKIEKNQIRECKKLSENETSFIVSNLSFIINDKVNIDPMYTNSFLKLKMKI